MKHAVFILIGVFALKSFAAPALRVLDKARARQTSYVTAELDGPLGFWVVDGKVLTLSETKKLIMEKGVIACAAWIMNYSDDKTLSKDLLQKSLIQTGKTIPLWMNVSGRPIYVDEATNFALSFVCASKDSQGQLVEVDSTDFARVFSGIFAFDK